MGTSHRHRNRRRLWQHDRDPLGNQRPGEPRRRPRQRRVGATYHCLGENDGLVVYDKPTLQKCYDLFAASPQRLFSPTRRRNT